MKNSNCCRDLFSIHRESQHVGGTRSGGLNNRIVAKVSSLGSLKISVVTGRWHNSPTAKHFNEVVVNWEVHP